MLQDKAAAKGKDSGDKKAAAAAPSGAPAAATAATTTASPEQTAQAPADAAPPAAVSLAKWSAESFGSCTRAEARQRHMDLSIQRVQHDYNCTS